MTQNDNSQTTQQSPKPNPHGAAGPLVVSTANPRYFTVDIGCDREAIYLTGSHIWHNFHDGMGPGSDCDETSEQLDYNAYLEFLKEHGHNFIRLWRWEQFKSQAAGGGFHLCMTPQPWPRMGDGTAKDGKPKFDLDSFDQDYFDRLRQRVHVVQRHDGDRDRRKGDVWHVRSEARRRQSGSLPHSGDRRHASGPERGHQRREHRDDRADEQADDDRPRGEHGARLRQVDPDGDEE